MSKSNHSLPKLVLTSGEPAGIGPDICLQIAQESIKAELTVIADIDLLVARAKQLNLNVTLNRIEDIQSSSVHKTNLLNVLHIPLAIQANAGQLNKANANYVLHMLEQACAFCLNKQVDAMVTGPLQKSVINDAGVSFSGHTEFLAEQCHATPLMLLACSEVRIALATTHLPLSKVAENITTENLENTIRILHADLQTRFGLSSPHITICGLNPHAGEGGHMGREEIDIIQPLIQKLNTEGLNLDGPVSADTAFTPEKRKNTDAYLCMFHDQGLPVLKTLGFGEAVNITLGLPIIRTSVDHGTALDLAGTGKADASSLLYAIDNAINMVNHQRV